MTLLYPAHPPGGNAGRVYINGNVILVLQLLVMFIWYKHLQTCRLLLYYSLLLVAVVRIRIQLSINACIDMCLLANLGKGYLSQAGTTNGAGGST